eukprot:c38998_g1_i1.p1 GENE.c38998_g1_i1~~c38998_g1_i1.p1  ORF type:complete len:886 (+),score=150.35 c38998_g1_i1:96-2660(+)
MFAPKSQKSSHRPYSVLIGVTNTSESAVTQETQQSEQAEQSVSGDPVIEVASTEPTQQSQSTPTQDTPTDSTHVTDSTPPTTPPNDTPPAPVAVDRCDPVRHNTKLFNDAGCEALLGTVKTGGKQCDSPCWFDMLVDLGELNRLDCLPDLDALEVSLRCQPIEEACGSGAAEQCTNTWVATGCSEQAPARCAAFQRCFELRKSECEAPFHASEHTALISFIVSIPISISASEFRSKFIGAVMSASAQSGGVETAQVSVISVTRGVIIAAEIAVSEAQAVEVYHRLDASLSSNEFRDHFNSKLPSSLQVEKVSDLALSSSVALSSVPPPVFPVPESPAPGPEPPAIQDPSVTPLELPLTLCPNNCSHHGKCVGLRQDGPGTCVCNKGYGRRNPTDAQDCSEFTLAMCPDLCFGHGLCRLNADSNEMVCECFDGYFGTTCNHWDRCKDRKFCNGRGSCTRSSPSESALPEACVCDHGYTGDRCEKRLLGCEENCGSHGICISLANHSRQCQCDPGFTGPTCVRVTPACPSSCSGLGFCDSTEKKCECQQGATGADCSVITQSCGHCVHGTCENDVCKCRPGFSGVACNIFNDPHSETDCKRLNFCSGNGICGFSGEAEACTCFVGTSGPDCSVVDADDASLCPNYCSGHGRCTLGSWAYSCTCELGWSGADCGTSVCPISRGKVCSGHGICEKTDAGEDFKCTCDPGFVSDSLNACEHSLCPNECSGHGRCNADGSCTCTGGFAGLDCSVSPSKARLVMAETSSSSTSKAISSAAASNNEQRDDEEQGPVLDLSSCLNSCSRHGECVMGTCQCKKGYSGSDCSAEMPSLFEEDNLDNLDLLELRSEERESIGKLWD